MKTLLIATLLVSTPSFAWGFDHEACLKKQRQGYKISCPAIHSEKEHGGSRGDVDDEAGERNHHMDDTRAEARSDQDKEE